MKLLLRLLAIVAGFLILRSLLAPLISAITRRLTPSPTPARAAPAGTATELKKDPVCGAFIAPEVAVTKTFNGQTLHFCSPQCRDAYSPSASA